MAMNRLLALSIDVLDYIQQRGGANMAELQQSFAIPLSTLYKIVHTLEAKKMLQKRQARGAKYTIGVRAFVIGSGYSDDLVATMKPFLELLSSKLNMTASLGVEEAGSVLYLDKSEPRQSSGFISSVRVGSTEGMYYTSLGKALLAELSRKEFDSKLDRIPFAEQTPFTCISKEDLWQNLLQGRKKGFYVDDEEHALGKVCLGVPLHNSQHKVIASVSVSGVKTRLTDFDSIAQKMLACLVGCPYRDE